MKEDDQFLRAIFEDPRDLPVRMVYADWLEERADPRAEYLRLDVELAALPRDHQGGPELRRRMLALRPGLPGKWLAHLGDHHVGPVKADGQRIEKAGTLLGRKVQFVDHEGYECRIVAAACNDFTGTLAYVESRAQQRGKVVDVSYHLRLRDFSGGEVARKIESYDPYFGCDVRFLEWYQHAVLMIYREKHQTYVCRYRSGAPALFRGIQDNWIVSGNQLGYRGSNENKVHRLRIPGLESLPSLTSEQAALWGLFPASASTQQ